MIHLKTPSNQLPLSQKNKHWNTQTNTLAHLQSHSNTKRKLDSNNDGQNKNFILKNLREQIVGKKKFGHTKKSEKVPRTIGSLLL